MIHVSEVLHPLILAKKNDEEEIDALGVRNISLFAIAGSAMLRCMRSFREVVKVVKLIPWPS